MSSSFSRSHLLVTTVLVCMMPLAIIGCDAGPDNTNTSSNNSETVKDRTPKTFSFHRPESYENAMSRIRELHEAISSSDPMPDPIEYQVKEVVHGEGPSGHSHFYFHDPAAESQEDFEPHDKDPFTGEAVGEDGHVTTDENIIDVKVDPFSELRDIMRWLPKIASGGDMPEAKWDQVNDISKELTPVLDEILEGTTDDDKRRASYLEKADSITGHLSTLEGLVK
jgi:hypothetical protein